MAKKKAFVIDTNVILHDSDCINNFGIHDVVIPITVIEELDNFKRGSQEINFHARKFTRLLDEISGDRIFNGGSRIASKKGFLKVRIDEKIHPKIDSVFFQKNADVRILNAAYFYAQENPDQSVVFVSKDVNLRMKAKAIGLKAEDYTNDQVQAESLYEGYEIIENVPAEFFDWLFSGPIEKAALKLFPQISLSAINQYFILRNGSRSALAHMGSDFLAKIEKKPVYGIAPRNVNQIFALHALLDPKIKLVSLTGHAGTGKTLLALAAALECKKDYRQIYIARPIVPLSNKDSGFLPGDIETKLDPFMMPLYDNLSVIGDSLSAQNGIKKKKSKSSQKQTEPEADINDLLSKKKIVVSPLSYIRGRSLPRIYFIVDEAQNLTPHEVKTIVSRAGDGTKVVFTGDIFQIDHPYLDVKSNGLSHLVERMRGQRLYAHINLKKGERSELADLASKLL